MAIDRRDTAVVFTDPQNEVLSETGLAWPLVRESLAENNTIENMERIFAAAEQHRLEDVNRALAGVNPLRDTCTEGDSYERCQAVAGRRYQCRAARSRFRICP